MNVLRYSTRKIINHTRRLKLLKEIQQCPCTTAVRSEITVLKPASELDEVDWNSEISKLKANDRNTILSPDLQDVSHVAPYFPPTFNLAAYVNKSDTLKSLVQLGVNLYKIEKKPSIAQFILKLDFERDMKAHIFFLHKLGVSSDDLGAFITKNPMIFGESLDNLQVRLNYLEYKKFKADMITRIVTKNPFWLMFSTQKLDQRLGHFQQTFKLSGDEVRSLTTTQPRLITYNFAHIKLNTFTIKEEMGFNDAQMKQLLFSASKLWMMSQQSIISRFDYVHNTMKISHEEILRMPMIFSCRKHRIEERHRFLETLGRAQYDPKRENYVSLEKLVAGTDSEFCTNVAKSSVQSFNTFLKSL